MLIIPFRAQTHTNAHAAHTLRMRAEEIDTPLGQAKGTSGIESEIATALAMMMMWAREKVSAWMPINKKLAFPHLVHA